VGPRLRVAVTIVVIVALLLGAYPIQRSLRQAHTTGALAEPELVRLSNLGAATILQPYPGTPIAKWAEERGLFDGNFDRLGFSYFAESPFRYPSRHDRERITNLQRLFCLAVEFPEVRTRLRRLIDRPPNRVYRFLFATRHTWGIKHTFYRAFTRNRPMEAGTPELLRRACRDLAID